MYVCVLLCLRACARAFQTYDPHVCIVLAGAIRTLLCMPRGCDFDVSTRPDGQPSRPGLCWVAAQERNPATWAAFCKEFERVERTADGTPMRASNDLADGEDATLWLDEIEDVSMVSTPGARQIPQTMPAQQAETETGVALREPRKTTEGKLRIVRIGTWASLFEHPAADERR
jgi:hypothetical protein